MLDPKSSDLFMNRLKIL